MLINDTKWLPTETTNHFNDNDDRNNKNNDDNDDNMQSEPKYNSRLSLCFYFRKIFDGEILPTNFSDDEIKNYVKLFSDAIGLHSNEVEYIFKLYNKEKLLCDLFDQYM